MTTDTPDSGHEDFIVDEHFSEGPLYLRPGCMAAGCKGHATIDELWTAHPVAVQSTSDDPHICGHDCPPKGVGLPHPIGEDAAFEGGVGAGNSGDEDVYQRAAVARHNVIKAEMSEDAKAAIDFHQPGWYADQVNAWAKSTSFRAAIDEARRDLQQQLNQANAELEAFAAEGDPTVALLNLMLSQAGAELAAARAEIAAQAATIAELRARITDLEAFARGEDPYADARAEYEAQGRTDD